MIIKKAHRPIGGWLCSFIGEIPIKIPLLGTEPAMNASKSRLFAVFLMITLLSGISCENRPREFKLRSGKLPHIVLFSFDTMRADHLSCYGYGRKTSPYIDQFASDAILFCNAISQAPTTSPAHMSIFTSLTPGVHRVRNSSSNGEFVSLSPSIKTLPEILKENGYFTAGFTDGGNIRSDIGFGRGFDRFAERHIKWDMVHESPEALNDIRHCIRSSTEAEQPLFLFLHTYLCHSPYTRAPKEFLTRFLDQKVEVLPVDNADSEQDSNPYKPRGPFWEKFNLNNSAHVKHLVSLYDGSIAYADYVFGEVMRVLKEESIYENAIIILLSDHGEEFLEHGTVKHSRLFIETLHVPLMIRFPSGNPVGIRIKEYVRTFDLMPTILDFLGIDARHFMQGISFMPLLSESGTYDPIIVSYDGYLTYVRVYENDYVYSNQPTEGTREWLFNISDDPRELDNLVTNSTSKTLDKMRNLTVKIWASDQKARRDIFEIHEERKQKVDENTREQLKALGYLE